MFQCTGVCSACRRCRNAAMMQEASDRKTKILTYPADFKPEKNADGYGVAFDIGTTTVVGMLWDLRNGKQIDTCAKTNPQNAHGMDVISRIHYCGKQGENLDVLRSMITTCLNEIIGALCKENKITRTEIIRASVCGNTTMSHIFAGYCPASLAAAPFDPAYTGLLEMASRDAKLDIGENAPVFVIPGIAGHVGGDITAGVAASRLLDRSGITVFIDIGTNGEIVVADSGKAMACSTAAGPAFEGAAILNGMRAAAGAIEKVRIEESGEVFFKTIGACEPQGICGSGLIDAVAQMLRAGLINQKGRLACAEDASKKNLPKTLQERLIEVGGERRFILVAKASGEDIVITQSDIREVQLAKGAIFSGIGLMLQEMGKTVADIDQIIVAGAFGNYIDKKSAVAIGLLPDVAKDKIILAGNTAGVGVSMALTSKKELDFMISVPKKVKHVELATKKEFQMAYMKAMAF